MHPRRVIRTNRSESIVKLSEMHSTLEVRKREVLVTPEVGDYATLIVSKYSDVIPCKFKAVKFMIE